MPQIVQYFEDFETEERRRQAFSEGPFVIVPLHRDFRIEVELPGHKCPVHVDTSIHEFLRIVFDPPVWTRGPWADMERICNFLNDAVRMGKIVVRDGRWQAVDY